MIKLDLPHLVADTDRHGNRRHYVRVRGVKKRRLPGQPGTPEFVTAYAEAMSEALAEAGGRKVYKLADKGTVAWLTAQYLASGAFTDLDLNTTQDRRYRILEEFVAAHGTKRADRLPRKALRGIMDAWKARHGPHGANNRMKALRGMYGWATERELIDRDVTREVGFYAPASDGWHTWTPAEIRKFMARWPLGTAARVAMTVMLCSGFRISDAYRVGPGHVVRRRVIGDDGKPRMEPRIAVKPGKTGKTSGITVDIPLLPMLREALAAGPTGAETFIVGVRGRPFASPEALGTSFKRWCVRAGLSHCSAHGLRKGGATILAENGATSSQLMAIFGWTKLEMAERYTRKADRSRLSDALSAGFGLDEEEG